MIKENKYYFPDIESLESHIENSKSFGYDSIVVGRKDIPVSVIGQAKQKYTVKAEGEHHYKIHIGGK